MDTILYILLAFLLAGAILNAVRAYSGGNFVYGLLGVVLLFVLLRALGVLPR